MKLNPSLVKSTIVAALGGLGIGGSSVLGPMYIAEIAPARLRGRLVGVFQFNVVFGILLAYFSNYLIGLRGFGAAEWRCELGVTNPRGALLSDAVWHPPQPTLARKEGAYRRSESRATDDRRGKLRARITGARGIDSCRTAAGWRSIIHSHSSFSDLPGSKRCYV